jgi:hypothetical protein
MKAKTIKVAINAGWGGFGLSEEALKALTCQHDHNYSRTDNRDCTELVRVIEELGERAGTKYAALKIVEIPCDVEWHIEEYDGRESVAENHRSWS